LSFFVSVADGVDACELVTSDLVAVAVLALTLGSAVGVFFFLYLATVNQSPKSKTR
jgi:hypothetical protein